MEIRIDGTSDVPIRRQLTEQVIFLIATERLKGGDLIPRVRELARRVKSNTTEYVAAAMNSYKMK